MIAEETESAERIRALLNLYRESHYDVTLPRGGDATIRVGTSAPPAVKRWLGAERVAFYLTACNPRSRSLTQEENERRLATLRAALRVAGCRYLDGAGHMPGERWREASVLAAGPGDEDVAALVREYDQNSIVVVRADAPAVLRIYRPDWREIVGDAADIEWASR